MNVQVWLYWFPVALAVGVAGALLGKSRGRAIGVLAALYWVSLSLAVVGQRPAVDATAILSLVLGALAMVWVGFWATAPVDPTSRSPKRRRKRPIPAEEVNANAGLLEVLTRFNDWLADNRTSVSPWPRFGEFVRTALYQTAGAKYVRAYRLLAETDELGPLRQIESEEEDRISARAGIIGYVMTTGKSYYAGDPSQGKLVEDLAAGSAHGCEWCFAIQYQKRTIGVIQVGEIDRDWVDDPLWLGMLERIIGLCWITLAEADGGRLASCTDPVTGVQTREAFMEAADLALQTSYAQGEPVALVNINIEGLRTLTDKEQWELANEATHEVSAVLKQRVRQEDEIGVCDGSSFLLLLRRVDSHLATLIVNQLMKKLSSLCGDTGRWGTSLTARCGLSGSGLGEPTLRSLVARATAGCRHARERNVPVVSDLPEPAEVVQG